MGYIDDVKRNILNYLFVYNYKRMIDAVSAVMDTRVLQTSPQVVGYLTPSSNSKEEENGRSSVTDVTGLDQWLWTISSIALFHAYGAILHIND